MPEAFGDDVVLTLREGHGVRMPILLVSSLDERSSRPRRTFARCGLHPEGRRHEVELVRRCREAWRRA